MLDITEINNTIEELENGSTTFDNCLKLASLYIVRDNYKQDEVEEELDDILPAYRKYVDIKTKFQLHETTQEAVIFSLETVCSELKELIITLYKCADFEQEREVIKSCITEVKRTLV